MTKKEMVAYLEGVNGKTIKLGLENVTALMEALGWPDEGQRIIHITGTNGKGSVCEMMSQILQQGGYKVGTFNTPYFNVHNECIRINNEMISDDMLFELMNQIEPVLKQLESEDRLPSGFEILTALALLYFKNMKVDFVILEVGLGGRLDATNVIKSSILTIITKIAMDHQGFLGNSLEDIAREKSGIIKKHGLVLVPEQASNVMDIIKSKCIEQKAKLNTLKSNEIKDIELSENGIVFKYKEESYKLSMAGKYQAYNASIAIEAMRLLKAYGYLPVSNEQIKKGIEVTKWTGRFEKVTEKPLCFLDGAHNVDGILALTETIEMLPKRRTIAIIGMLKDKEIDAMLKIIMPYIDTCIVTKPLNPRAEDTKILAQKVKGYIDEVYIREEIKEAYELALEQVHENEEVQIIGYGSLYMIGELRKIIIEEAE